MVFRRPEMLAFESRLFGGEEYRLRGTWDPGERAAWEAATRHMSTAFPEITEANVPRLRDMTRPDPALRSAADREAIGAGETTTVSVDGNRFGSPGNPDIQVRVHVPLAGSGGAGAARRKGLVFYHGGAFVLGCAADEDPWACRTSVECDLVVFNVDYRNGSAHTASAAAATWRRALRWNSRSAIRRRSSS